MKPADDPQPAVCSPCLLVLHLATGDTAAFAGAYHDMLERLRGDPQAASGVRLASIDACDLRPADGLLQWSDAVQARVPRLVGNVRAGVRLPTEAVSEILPSMRLGLREIERFKRELSEQGATCRRPWIVVLSDTPVFEAAPQWSALALDCRQAERDRRCALFPVAVDGQGASSLQELTLTPVATMPAARLPMFFGWLADALVASSRTDVGSMVSLPPVGHWATLGQESASSALRTAPSMVPG